MRNLNMMRMTKPMTLPVISPRQCALWAIFASFTAIIAPPAAHAQDVPGTEQALAAVTVARIGQADMVAQVPISGTLVAREEILVYPQVSGSTIDTLLVDIGDTVTAGDVLATLDDSTLTAQLAQSQAELARAAASINQARSQITSATASETQAAAALERAQTLRENGSGTQATLDQALASQGTAAAAVASARDGLAVAEAQQQQAQAQLDIASLNLDRATLRAPADGLISTRNGQVGAIAASTGEPIFRIIRDGLIEVEAEVIETALGTISIGDPATLRIAGGGQASGTVRRISPTVDPRNRLGTIRIAIVDPGALRTGVFASGDIVTEQRSTLAVPTAAVLTDSGGTYVLAVIDDRLEKRYIDAGLIWNGLREIADGLDDDAVVVARAGAFFGDGDRIAPIFAADDSAQEASQ
jgi:HlyD family secretion protein